MTDKELRKLKRGDFLQLLIAQGKDMSEVQNRLDRTTEKLEELQDANENLRSELAERDEEIAQLRAQLDNKDATISALRQEIEDMNATPRIEIENVSSVAATLQNLDGIFESAKTETDQYLTDIRSMHSELETMLRTARAEQESLRKTTVEQNDPQLADSEPVPETEQNKSSQSSESEDKTDRLTKRSKREITSNKERNKGFFINLRRRGDR